MYPYGSVECLKPAISCNCSSVGTVSIVVPPSWGISATSSTGVACGYDGKDGHFHFVLLKDCGRTPLGVACSMSKASGLPGVPSGCWTARSLFLLDCFHG